MSSGLDSKYETHLVDGDTGAQDWCSVVQRKAIRDWSELRGVGDGKLLEGSIDRVARALGRFAEWFVSLSAELAFLRDIQGELRYASKLHARL